MTSLATFGTFVLAALGSVVGLYRFYLNQRKQRDKEIADRAVADYINTTSLVELRKKVAELEGEDSQ